MIIRSIKIVSAVLIVFLLATALYIEKTKKIPEYSVLFHEKGLNCKEHCSQNKKIQYFQKAIYHNPEFSESLYQLALDHELNGEYEQSHNLFRKVTELDSDNITAVYKVGRHYFDMGDHENALEYLNQALMKKSGFPDDLHYYLARIYDQKGDHKLALRYYNNIVSLRPEYASQIYPRSVELYHSINRSGSIIYEVRRLREANRHQLADQLEESFKDYQISNVHE